GAQFEIVSELKENPMHMGLFDLDDIHKLDDNGKVGALVIVNCGLEDVFFQSIYGKIYQTGSSGQYRVVLKERTQYFVIQKQGYGNYKYPFPTPLKSGTVYEMAIDEKSKQPDVITFVITSNEDNASVYANGELLGKTENRVFTADLPIGNNEIEVIKSGYKSKVINHNLSPENNKVVIDLVPSLPTAVTITTEPKGATIYIDNVLFGTSPKSSFFNEGTYPIRIEKESFAIINENITITDPETKKHYELNDIRATLTINSNPEAIITMNGTIYQGEIKELKLLPQMLNIRVEQDFCETINETYNLEAMENKVFSLYPKNLSGTLTVNTHSKAEVDINGKIFTGSVTEERYMPGLYKVIVTQEFCETLTESVYLESNQNKVFDLYPQDISGWLTIKTDPSAMIYVNDKYYSEVNNMKFIPQVLEIRVLQSNADDIIKIVTLKAGDEKVLELYPEIRRSRVDVVTIPTSSEIKLSGESGNNYRSVGKHSFMDIPVGSYELVVSNDGYMTHRETFVLTAENIIQKQITLKEGRSEELFESDNFVFVEGSTFQIGSTNENSNKASGQILNLSDYYIGKYEVTQLEWKEVMQGNPSRYKNDMNPVENVSWYDAVDFCNKKSIKDGLEAVYSGTGENIECDFSKNGYRLPTEAEWEYAARGGKRSQAFIYSGSNNIDEVAEYRNNNNSSPKPVGGKNPNELGIYDMSGNVWEWCWDIYVDSIEYSKKTPTVPDSGHSRVGRGGSYSSKASRCKITDRSGTYPTNFISAIGFRVVRKAD
nr:SUMF1/EgtB/PvdO family nonheme iron enzyme [bacterium]